MCLSLRRIRSGEWAKSRKGEQTEIATGLVRRTKQDIIYIYMCEVLNKTSEQVKQPLKKTIGRKFGHNFKILVWLFLPFLCIYILYIKVGSNWDFRQGGDIRRKQNPGLPSRSQTRGQNIQTLKRKRWTIRRIWTERRLPPLENPCWRLTGTGRQAKADWLMDWWIALSPANHND